MTKYYMYKNTSEFKYRERYEIKEGCTVERDSDVEAELIETFDNKADALKTLGEYKSSVNKMKGNSSTYFNVIEYYVEKVDYDEDGEWLNGDILEYSKMSINVVEKPSYDTLGTFDDYKTAEQYAEMYSGDGEAYIE